VGKATLLRGAASIVRKIRRGKSQGVWNFARAFGRKLSPRRDALKFGPLEGDTASISSRPAPCGRGGIGRRAGLKIRFRKEYRFDPGRPHQLAFSERRRDALV
jgi:hypothetical protein